MVTNIENLHFLWKVAGTTDEEFFQCQQTIEKAKEEIPVYHTRAMRRALFSRFGKFSHQVKPAVLRAFYKELTNDSSAPTNLNEAEIDERVLMMLDTEDSNIVIDLRHLNSRRRGQYDDFWKVNTWRIHII